MGASMQEIYKIFPGGWDKYIPVSDFPAKRKPRLSKYHGYFTVSVLHILGGGGGFFRDKGADGFDIGAAAYTGCAGRDLRHGGKSPTYNGRGRSQPTNTHLLQLPELC